MLLSGFTYIRNRLQLKYPFVESIKSALPICDEMVVVVGDSSDGSRESIENIGSPKIRIIDSVWDETLKDGLIFREQTNLSLDNIDAVESFPESSHPEVMKELVQQSGWKLDNVKLKFNLKNWLSKLFESMTGYRIGEYTNWKIIRKP